MFKKQEITTSFSTVSELLVMTIISGVIANQPEADVAISMP